MNEPNNFKKNIPNAITLLNVFAGCCALVSVMDYRQEYTIGLVLLAGLFDFADGLVARALGVHSELGKQLDSLADMISFGLVPGAIMFKMLYIGTQHDYLVASIGFLITVFSALRLAIFNLDTRQSDVFIGLATPASTIFILGVWVWVEHYFFYAMVQTILIITTFVVSALLVAPIPMFSNKFKGSAFRGNELRYIFMGIVAISLILWGRFAFAPIVLLYIIISLVQMLFAKAAIDGTKKA